MTNYLRKERRKPRLTKASRLDRVCEDVLMLQLLCFGQEICRRVI
jgi:hypothetical protein